MGECYKTSLEGMQVFLESLMKGNTLHKKELQLFYDAQKRIYRYVEKKESKGPFHALLEDLLDFFEDRERKIKEDVEELDERYTFLFRISEPRHQNNFYELKKDIDSSPRKNPNDSRLILLNISSTFHYLDFDLSMLLPSVNGDLGNFFYKRFKESETLQDNVERELLW